MDNKSSGFLDRLARASANSSRGNHAAALEDLLSCFDYREARDRSFDAVRWSFVLCELRRLGTMYPEARAALYDRRDKAKRVVLAGEADSAIATDFVMLNVALDEVQQTVDAYTKLKATVPSDVRTVLFRASVPSLVASQHYDEVFNGNPNISAEVVDRLQQTLVHIERFLASGDVEIARELERYDLEDVGAYYEVLVGVKRSEEAQIVSDAILAFSNSWEAYALLVERAARAGAEQVAQKIFDRGMASLPQDEAVMLRTAGERIF